MTNNSTRFYVVDAFTGEAFKGNPAVVCLLKVVKDDQWLQAVASEFNIPITAYVTPIQDSVQSTAPYWSKNLGKFDFVAYQASPRGGVIDIHFDAKNQRVFLRGEAVVVSEGSILV